MMQPISASHQPIGINMGSENNSLMQQNRLQNNKSNFITLKERLNMKINHVSVGQSQKEVDSMFELPKIHSRKLDDLDNMDENPFRVMK